MKRVKISEEDYALMVSCLPANGEKISVEDWREKYMYEFGRQEAIRNSKEMDMEFYKRMLIEYQNDDVFPAAWIRGYVDYANAYMIINRGN